MQDFWYYDISGGVLACTDMALGRGHAFTFTGSAVGAQLKNLRGTNVLQMPTSTFLKQGKGIRCFLMELGVRFMAQIGAL